MTRLLLSTGLGLALMAQLQAQVPAPPKGFETVDHQITITTIEGLMKYDVETFTVSPGSRVKLTLKNNDNMPHNLVICLPGKNNGIEVAGAALQLGVDGFEKHWIPKHPKLYFNTIMINPNESRDYYFKAPAQADDYPYVCTVPGHAALMNGVMKVGSGAAPSQDVVVNSTTLQNLTYKVYKGGWNKLPDFASMTPFKSGEAKDDLIDIHAYGIKDNFGVAYDGKLVVAKQGSYKFRMGSDDGSKLIIDGKTVVDNDGIHGVSWKEGTVALAAGEHHVQALFFEKAGGEDLFLSYSGPGLSETWLSKQKGTSGGGGGNVSGIPIRPPPGEAKMYRNFIQDAGARAIGVGYPEQINLAFDANRMNLSMVWLGGFMDGKRHWSGRGTGFQSPAGYAVIKLPNQVPFGKLETEDAPWPIPEKRVMDRFEGYRFHGYTLDDKQFPTFIYEYDGVKLLDHFNPRGLGGRGIPEVKRIITCLNNRAPRKIWFLAATGNSIAPTANGFYSVDGKYLVSVEASKFVKTRVRQNGNQAELLAEIHLPNAPVEIIQTIRWP